MEAVQYIKELKNFSTNYVEDESRELININKYPKNEYSIGFITNLLNNEYEVYMFISSDVEEIVASGLLCKNFNDLDQANEYYNELVKKYKDMDLAEIANNL